MISRVELRRAAEQPPLTRCPLCRKPVSKVISRTNTPKVSQPLGASEAKNAGFSIWKRREKGLYESL